VKRRRHTPDQIIRKLREAERMLAEGSELPAVAKALEVSEQTFNRWRAQYGGMKADDAKRLRELERENARLKRIVADKELEADALRELAKGRIKVKCGRIPCSFAVAAGGASRRPCARRQPGRARPCAARPRAAARG